MSKKDEFIYRNTQLPSEGPVPATDMAQARAASDEAKRTPLGTPGADFTVRSTFDSRPVSGYDYNIAVAVTAEGPQTSLTASFTVPLGYIAVQRRIHHFFVPLPPSTARSDFLASFLVNNNQVPNNTLIPIGIESDDILTTFFVADENQTVSLVVAGTIPALTVLWVHFYGNFVLKTGRPAIFETANLAEKTGVVTSRGSGITEQGMGGLQVRPRLRIRRR